MENIHSEMYSLLIDTYIRDAKRKSDLFNAIDRIPCIKKKAEWALKYIESDKATFQERLIAFATRYLLRGSFCAIFLVKETWINARSYTSNELILRDEGLHTEFATVICSMLTEKLEKSRLQQIITDEIEKEFITESIP